MELKVTVKIEGAILNAIMKNPGEVGRKSVWAGMTNLVEEIEARAKKEAPAKTSNLRRHIVSSVSPDGARGVITSQAPYSVYVHEGTGLFGPLHKRIVPTTKKALFWPGASHPVRSTKGMKANPFFTRALAATKTQQVFEAGVWGYLNKMGA